jgi:hypothetical protein
MRTSRSLAAAAASVLLSIALVAGSGVAAQAATPPSPFPVIPSPGFPAPGVPVPVGPVFTIPGCATLVPTTAINATRAFVPGFGSLANLPGLYGAQATTLTNVIAAHSDAVTCSFGVGGSRQVVVTATRITPAEFKIVNYWYTRNAVAAIPGGGPVWPGTAVVTHYFVGTGGPGGAATEVAALSRDGWWITVRDVARIGALPYFEMDVVAQFLTLNPRLPR